MEKIKGQKGFYKEVRRSSLKRIYVVHYIMKNKELLVINILRLLYNLQTTIFLAFPPVSQILNNQIKITHFTKKLIVKKLNKNFKKLY